MGQFLNNFEKILENFKNLEENMELLMLIVVIGVGLVPAILLYDDLVKEREYSYMMWLESQEKELWRDYDRNLLTLEEVIEKRNRLYRDYL